jgi:group I intron endonuclease
LENWFKMIMFSIDKYYLIDDSKFYIYKITSPSGKVYIGQTTSPKRRFKCYKNLYCKGQLFLYNSFVKHGVFNHTFEVLETYNNDTDISILNDREIFYIKDYKNRGFELLNLDEGGRNARKSEETRKKLSNSRIGKYEGGLNPMYGKTHTADARLKISIANKGRKMTKENREKLTKIVSKPIIQYNKNGEFIREWNNAVEIAKELSFNSRVINSQARGLRKSAYGFIWKYKNS